MFLFIQGQDPQPACIVDAHFRQGGYLPIRPGDPTIRGRAGRRRLGAADILSGAAGAAALVATIDTLAGK